MEEEQLAGGRGMSAWQPQWSHGSPVSPAGVAAVWCITALKEVPSGGPRGGLKC